MDGTLVAASHVFGSVGLVCGHDEGPASGVGVSLLDYGGGIGTDHAADRHEEAVVGKRG